MSKWTTAEGHFKSFDGTELFYRSWKPLAPVNRALVVIHRGHEHSGRVSDQVEELDLQDVWAFSWDCRGHGHSPGERGYAKSYDYFVKDLNAFVMFISARHDIPIENMAILANSVGAVTASTWVHDYAPRIRAMVLAAPAFIIRLYIPFAIPLLRLVQGMRGKVFISSYVKSKMLTHDPEQSRKYDEDRLITRNIAVNILLGLHDTATRILADAGAIFTPTLILSAGSDWVVKNSAQRRFFAALSSARKEMHVYPKFFHAVLYEKHREEPISRARQFIIECFETPPETSFFINQDREGYTRREFDRLRQPAPPITAAYFGVQKLLMQTLGRLSTGVRLGCQTGFDSGKSLDYVYKNQAHGITFLGRMIDRHYLDAVGWQGIRERRENLGNSLRWAIDAVSAAGKAVRIVDIAAGPGRYVLEVIRDLPDMEITVLLRDRDPGNLQAGKDLARSMGLASVKFEAADAFDRESLLSITPAPSIVIVSGLYELFSDNQPVLKSIEGIAGVLQDNGYLLYTCQPWHPQIEMIARTLINRDGEPWIMRRRTQAEMDELVRSAGLTKIDTKIDSHGIFTVSIAQKMPA
ncbi:MAG: bifunctional alpha/beta hydrolase/class I SAM-dependent methyltransferase [Gammaproteobacteria bacterium]|nr:bifunctional alpha/beta hydrolase/class I SAM-dependent methyltransferase [Gammaproteobacteria bacterium]